MLLQSTNGKLETNFLHLKKWFIRKICDNAMFFWKKGGGKSPTCKSVHACSVAKSHPTLCESMDCGPPDSSGHGIFQTKILEWIAISCSMRLSQSTD